MVIISSGQLAYLIELTHTPRSVHQVGSNTHPTLPCVMIYTSPDRTEKPISLKFKQMQIKRQSVRANFKGTKTTGNASAGPAVHFVICFVEVKDVSYLFCLSVHLSLAL